MTAPPEKKAPGANPGTFETTIEQLAHSLRSGTLRQVRIVADDSVAQAIAVDAGIALILASVPPSRNGVAIAIGRLPSGAVAAVVRWHGWLDAANNGWLGILGSEAAVLRAATAFGRAVFVDGTVRAHLPEGQN